jgi:hypothetical protein
MAHGGTTLATLTPLTAAPPAPTAWHVHQEIAPCPGAPQLGRTVAMHGQWLLIGSWHDQDLGVTPPVVHASRLSGQGWSCDTPIEHPALDPHADFGRAITIHGDLLAIGAPRETVRGLHASGAVHVFRHRGDGWRHVGTIHAPVLQGGAEFGASVALHGQQLLVGSPRWDHGVSNFDEGRADLYAITDAGIEHRAALQSPTPVQGGRFGFSVAINETMMAMGAPWEPGTSVSDRGGAVHVGMIPAIGESGPWATARLGSHAANEWLGWSIALTDRDLVVGAPRADGGALSPSTIGRRRGCVVTAQLTSSGLLMNEQRVWGFGHPEEHVGLSVSVSCDWIIAGAPTSSDAEPLQGAAYLFKRMPPRPGSDAQGRRWRTMQRVLAQNSIESAGVGATVAISGPWAAAARTGDPEQPITPGSCLVLSLDWVQPFDDLAPALGALARDEGILHRPGIGVVGGELDAELPHVTTGRPIPMDDAR